jgi:hypothetical protein
VRPAHALEEHRVIDAGWALLLLAGAEASRRPGRFVTCRDLSRFTAPSPGITRPAHSADLTSSPVGILPCPPPATGIRPGTAAPPPLRSPSSRCSDSASSSASGAVTVGAPAPSCRCCELLELLVTRQRGRVRLTARAAETRPILAEFGRCLVDRHTAVRRRRPPLYPAVMCMTAGKWTCRSPAAVPSG